MNEEQTNTSTTESPQGQIVQQQEQQPTDTSDTTNDKTLNTNPSTKDIMELRELWLPIANVARIMKSALPPNAKISKEAKECVQECVSEFVSFITSEASDKCIYEKRKTVNGEDILFAMASLGMDQYSSVLQIYLAKYRESQMLKQEKEGKKKGKEKNGGEEEGQIDNDDEEQIYEDYAGHYTNVDNMQY